MVNPHCKHKMVRSIGWTQGDYPGQPVFYCPHGGCAQWRIEFPAQQPSPTLSRLAQLASTIKTLLCFRMEA